MGRWQKSDTAHKRSLNLPFLNCHTYINTEEHDPSSTREKSAVDSNVLAPAAFDHKLFLR